MTKTEHTILILTELGPHGACIIVRCVECEKNLGRLMSGSDIKTLNRVARNHKQS